MATLMNANSTALGSAVLWAFLSTDPNRPTHRLAVMVLDCETTQAVRRVVRRRPDDASACLCCCPSSEIDRLNLCRHWR